MTIALQGQVLNNKIISTSYNDLAEINLVEMLNQEYNFPVFLQMKLIYQRWVNILFHQI